MYILGFEGRTCEVNIDDCHNHQCKNGGTCLDGIKTYTCQCPPTYTGMYCQTDVDECQQRPNICKVWIPCFFKVMLIDIYTFFMPWLNVFFCFFYRMVLLAQIPQVLSLVFVLMDGQEKIAVKILMIVPVQHVSTELPALIE